MFSNAFTRSSFAEGAGGGGERTESWYGSAANDVTTKKRERTNKLGNEIADEMCFTWNPLFFLLTAYFTRRGAPSYEPRRGAEGYADEDRPVTNDVLPCRARESKKMNGTVFEFCPFFSFEFPRVSSFPMCSARLASREILCDISILGPETFALAFLTHFSGVEQFAGDGKLGVGRWGAGSLSRWKAFYLIYGGQV